MVIHWVDPSHGTVIAAGPYKGRLLRIIYNTEQDYIGQILMDSGWLCLVDCAKNLALCQRVLEIRLGVEEKLLSQTDGTSN